MNRVETCMHNKFLGLYGIPYSFYTHFAKLNFLKKAVHLFFSMNF